MYRFVSSLSRNAKRYILLTIDVLLVPVALLLAFALQQNGLPAFDNLVRVWAGVPLLMMIAALLVAIVVYDQ